MNENCSELVDQATEVGVGSMAGSCLVNYYKFNLDMPFDECQKGEWTVRWETNEWWLVPADE